MRTNLFIKSIRTIALLTIGAVGTFALHTAHAEESIIPVYDKINTDREILSDEDIKAALKSLVGWRHADGKLTKTFVADDFQHAIAFIVSFSYVCEKIDHHPEIFSVYNKVVISTTTYDAGQKISSFDIRLAKLISEKAKSVGIED